MDLTTQTTLAKMRNIANHKAWDGKVDITRIRPSSPMFLSRAIDPEHVQRLVRSFRTNPKLPMTFVIVALDWPPHLELTVEDLYDDATKVEIIGGNHSHAAIHHLIKEDPAFNDPLAEQFTEVYCNLKPAECVFLSEELNISHSLHRSQTAMSRMSLCSLSMYASTLVEVHYFLLNIDEAVGVVGQLEGVVGQLEPGVSGFCVKMVSK